MKFLKSILAVVGIIAALAGYKAEAQGLGGDVYGGTRTLIVQPLTNSSIAGLTTALTTNTVVDLRLFQGIVKLDIQVFTNAPGNITNVIQTSADMTNWVALTGYALSTSKTINYTNGLNTNNIATNIWILPGVITVPSAATAGNVSPYLAPAAMTNTSGTINVSAGGTFQVGFVASDQNRFLQVYQQWGGPNTNFAIGQILTGKTEYGPPNP